MTATLPVIEATDQVAYRERLEAARALEKAVAPQALNGTHVTWCPQAGSQKHFMQCPIFECLYHGTRGPGKTDALIMSFGQHVGRGHGHNWRGVIFRRTYPELGDLVAKSEKWFRQIFPRARYNRSKFFWQWPDGEMLMFRHMARVEDYWNYHGHEYPFVAFEELTNWPDDECYRKMFACCRSSSASVPRMIRATTNPYGVGHNWVKDRFDLHGQWWKTVVTENPSDVDGNPEPPRCAIHGHIDENKILTEADPKYKQTITAAATSDAMVKAWLHGSWDIVAGGMFDDVWDQVRNIVPAFVVPRGWRIDRSFDWGSTRPFSVGWWAQSDGSDLALPDGRVVSTVRGDLFRVREWYGSTGRPNQGLRMLAIDVAKGIVERELMWGWRDKHSSMVKPGPADSHIYVVENGVSIAHDMAQPVRIGSDVHKGVGWARADKRAGSRKLGWEMMRKMISNAKPGKDGPRELPGLFVLDGRCPDFLRTVLALPRDEDDMDDVDTDSEDHVGDEARYRVRAVGTGVSTGSTVGLY